jgi:hypothetical protein
MRFQAGALTMESGTATMASPDSPGVLLRLWTALVDALKRGLLGKSSNAYMKQFAGGAEYWDRAIAAQNGCHQKSPQPGADSPGQLLPLEFEPVHGWTRRQLRAYLARNPAYVSTYEAALKAISGRIDPC